MSEDQNQVKYLTPDLASLQPVVDMITASPVPAGMSYNDVHRVINNLTSFAEISVFNFNKLRAANGEPPWTEEEIRAMGVPVVDGTPQP